MKSLFFATFYPVSLLQVLDLVSSFSVLYFCKLQAAKWCFADLVRLDQQFVLGQQRKYFSV